MMHVNDSSKGADDSAVEWTVWEHETRVDDVAHHGSCLHKVGHFFAPSEAHPYVHNSIPMPSIVFVHDDTSNEHKELSLFRRGVNPVAIDPKNASGGCWRQEAYDLDELDNVWKNLTQAVLDPESKLDHGHINGVHISDKSGDEALYEVEVWLDTKDEEDKNRIKEQLMSIIAGGDAWKHPIDLAWHEYERPKPDVGMTRVINPGEWVHAEGIRP